MRPTVVMAVPARSARVTATRRCAGVVQTTLEAAVRTNLPSTTPSCRTGIDDVVDRQS
jgi:hypothetical protein